MTTDLCDRHRHGLLLGAYDHEIEAATGSMLDIVAGPGHHHADTEAHLRVATIQKMDWIFDADCPTRYLISRFLCSMRDFPGRLMFNIRCVRAGANTVVVTSFATSRILSARKTYAVTS